MNLFDLIAIGSLLVSILTFIFMQIGLRHTIKTDYVSELETKLQTLRDEVTKGHTQIDKLTERCEFLMKENLVLLRQIAQAKLFDNHNNKTILK